MGLNAIVEAILKIGLPPVLVLLALFWHKERSDKTIQYLEEQNKMLLDKVLEEK